MRFPNALVIALLFGTLSAAGPAAASGHLEMYAGLTDEEKKAKIEDMYQGYKKEFPEVAEITVQETFALENPVIVDARTQREQDVSVIPGSIPQRSFEQNSSRYRGHPVVVYCTIGNRSGFYARKLKQQGFESYNLKGGILSWVFAGQPVVKGKLIRQKVHTFGPQWALLPKTHEAVFP